MTRINVLRAASAAVATVIAMALGACQALPALHYYTLDIVNPANPIDPGTGLLVRIRHVGVPHEMDHQGLTHRAGPTQLVISDHDQWSASLGVMIQGTLIRDLGARLGYEHVLALDALPLGANPGTDQSAASPTLVDLDFVSLSADEACAIAAQVNWTVSAPAGPQRRGTAKLAAPASGCPAGLAPALSAALGDLADQLVPALAPATSPLR